MSSEETIQAFIEHWETREPKFRLDDPEVREAVAVLLSAMMSLLAVAPPDVWQKFMHDCGNIARSSVPSHIQDIIKGVIEKKGQA